MSQLVSPHGRADLNPLLLEGQALSSAVAKAKTLKQVAITSREAGDLIMLGIGGFTPLSGFMGSADWESVCRDMHLSEGGLKGVFWPIPITVSTTVDIAESVGEAEEVALAHDGEVMAILTVTEKYQIDKSLECESVFKTQDSAHPGVKMVMDQAAVNLAGPVQVLSQGHFPEKYPAIYMTPKQTRAAFKAKGWSTVAAFQTRNPMHRSHEHLAKLALESFDGVMIHSLLGNLKPGDIPAQVRQEAISALVTHYFVEDTVLQAGYPLDMRYAGPREALLHALFRQNYGCSHLIVGRDHAGVGDYYGPFDAQHIFDEIPEDALQTKAFKIDWAFWCNTCGNMATLKTCPHPDSERVIVSGTKLRKALSENAEVPDNFSRPEVLAILRKYYASLKEDQKVSIELKGHSAR